MKNYCIYTSTCIYTRESFTWKVDGIFQSCYIFRSILSVSCLDFVALSSLEPDPKKLATLRSDVTLSSCEVKVEPHKCEENGCGEGSLDVTAITDFIEDGDRTSRIATARVRGNGLYGWEAHDPPDVDVCNLPTYIHYF